MQLLPGTRRIGIFLPNWIGDAVMATPFLRALQRRYGEGADLIGIARPYVIDVLSGNPWLSEIVSCDKQRGGWSGVWKSVRTLRALQLDTVVLLTNSLRTAALAWATGARRRIGYARGGRSWLLTDVLSAPRAAGRWLPISAVDYYLKIAEHLGCDATDRTLELPNTPRERLLAKRAWHNLGLTAARPVVALHAAGGWGGTATAKAWPVEHFAALAARLTATFNVQVLVLCGPNEIDTAREITRLAADSRVVSLAEQNPSLGLTRGCLERAALLVSTDSGPRHIATALNIPTVGLFGATDPRWAQTYHQRGTVVYNQLPCGPCGEKHCPLQHHRCMRELSVDRVFDAAAAQLAEPLRRAA